MTKLEAAAERQIRKPTIAYETATDTFRYQREDDFKAGFALAVEWLQSEEFKGVVVPVERTAFAWGDALQYKAKEPQG